MAVTAARSAQRRRAGPRSLRLREGPVDPGGGSRRRPLRRLFAVGACATALVTVAAVLVGGLALYQLSEARRVLLDADAPAAAAGQQLTIALLDQQSGVRGFIASGGRDEFLDQFVAGATAEQQAATTLRRLAAGGELGEVDSRLGRVESAARRWQVDFAEPSIAAFRAGIPAPDPMVGRARFGALRSELDALTGDLEAQQAQARDQVGDTATALLVITATVAVALIAFLVAVGIGLQRGVLAPVSRLALQVRDVVSGDVTRPVEAAGPREIAELGADVEAMRTHILRELDELQDVNRRLDEQARDLERSNRDLEQFAYVASHDLQEPLRKVSRFGQLLQRRYGGRLDERADQYIDFAVDGAQRMQRLINDLLTFSRVGRSTAGFGPVELGEVVSAAAAQLEAARTEAGGEIVIGELPELPGDPALLRQLLINLIANGLKFRRADVAPVVRVSAEPVDGAWEITVADNGIGIEPEYVDKVFVIFQRLHGRDRYPGTGIGLALAKKIVEFHGGRIGIDTTHGGPGTIVRFTLPTPQETT